MIYKNTRLEWTADTAVETKNTFLQNIRIGIVGGGGIAALEIPKIARELRRYGASVQCVVTEACLQFVGLTSLEWATQSPVITHLSGLAEHICTFDALVVAPATADLFAKSSLGLCTDGPSTLIQSALGLKTTLLFCPTMHSSLANSPFVQKNKETLSLIENVFFLNPVIAEGKHKLPSPQDIALNLAHIINRKPYKVLVTGGGTRVMIDSVRCLTNLSTGRLAQDTCRALYAQGIKVDFYSGVTDEPTPLQLFWQVKQLPLYQDMYNALQNLSSQDYEGIFYLAAASDFKPTQAFQEKLSSQELPPSLSFEILPKLLHLKTLQNIPFRVAAKLTDKKTPHEGLKEAENFLKKQKLHAVLWNHRDDVWNHNTPHKATVLQSSSQTPLTGKKAIAEYLAQLFLDFVTLKRQNPL
jgi:phosphopantothenoylcysteine decarboxylase / phosphopantothenate---cysteine ligase